MALNPPPIQQRPVDQNGLFDRIWSLWFSSLKTEIDVIDGGSP